MRLLLLSYIRAAVAVVLPAIFVACNLATPEGECVDHGDCAGDDRCVHGICVVNTAGACDGIDCSDEQVCYRGVCYDACDAQTDCASEERCGRNACVPLDCQGVDCPGDEICYRGVCYLPCETDDECNETDAECLEGACVAPSCDDGLQSGGQTDVDCGGDNCQACELGRNCVEVTDCVSERCHPELDVCVECIEEGDCENEEICTDGHCVAESSAVCNGESVNLARDSDHCGACDNSCGEGTTGECVDGHCQALHHCEDTADSFGGGDGTLENPYLICNAEQLGLLSAGDDDLLDGAYLVVDALDLQQAHWQGVSGEFRGEFDGNHHRIADFVIDSETRGFFDSLGSDALVQNAAFEAIAFEAAEDSSGLVAGQTRGTIRRVSIDDAQLDGDGDAVGGLAGVCADQAVIADSTVSGTVAAREQVGGLVGRAEDGCAITDARAAVEVEAQTTAGGAVGTLLDAGSVRRSSATGAVELHEDGGFAGGLVGRMQGADTAVTASFAAADDGEAVGGLVGGAVEGAEIFDSYAVGDVRGHRDVGGLIGRLGDPASPATGDIVQQTAESTADGLTEADWEQTPREGNLLVALSSHRMSWQNVEMQSAGWTFVERIDGHLEESKLRRGLAMWYKIADADESMTVAIEWSNPFEEPYYDERHHAVILREFQGPYTGLDAVATNTSGDEPVAEISTGTTETTSHQASVVVAAKTVRGDAAPAEWTNRFRDNFRLLSVDFGAPFSMTLQSAHRIAEESGAWESTAEWEWESDPAVALALIAAFSDAEPTPVVRSYSVGRVDGDIGAGGLVGANGQRVVSSYWWVGDDAGDQVDSSEGGIGLTASEFGDDDSFDRWDFDDVWRRSPSTAGPVDDRPLLWWEVDP